MHLSDLVCQIDVYKQRIDELEQSRESAAVIVSLRSALEDKDAQLKMQTQALIDLQKLLTVSGNQIAGRNEHELNF